MTKIRHIVFDIGNVLIRWDPELLYRRLIPDDAERRRFMAEICSHDWNLEQDRGRAWSEAEDILIRDFPNEAPWIRAWRANWHEMVPGALDDSVVVLEQLIADGHDVTALTNFAEDTFEEAQTRFPFLRGFRGVTVSGAIRLVKPDTAIYHHHAESFGLDPKATLFFDDMPANIAGARSAGWEAERFIDPTTLRTDLARYGIAGF